jgi:bifunctional non-homologous end joining protein LigD
MRRAMSQPQIMSQPEIASQQPTAVGELEFIAPCLPCIAMLPPSGDSWLHEVKREGRRMLARRAGANVRLFNGRGEDWTIRFPQIAQAVGMLPIRSCTIDGEVVGCDADGFAWVSRLRDPDADNEVALHAFDLLEVNGFDTRRDAIEDRKRALAHLLRKKPTEVRFNPHFEREGEAVFEQACRMGFAGIISKRRGSRYLSGRSSAWLLTKRMD